MIWYSIILKNTLLVGLDGIAAEPMKYHVAKRPLAVTCTTFLITAHCVRTMQEEGKNAGRGARVVYLGQSNKMRK
jgi:hypothetical protein